MSGECTAKLKLLCWKAKIELVRSLFKDDDIYFISLAKLEVYQGMTLNINNNEILQKYSYLKLH